MTRRRKCSRSFKRATVVATIAFCLQTQSDAFHSRSPCHVRHRYSSTSPRRLCISMTRIKDDSFLEEQRISSLSIDESAGDVSAANHSAVVSHAAIQTSSNEHQITPQASSDKLKLGFITCTSILMLLTLYQISGRGTWRYYLAGGMCAAISHTVPVPIDVVKTRKQVDPSLGDATLSEAFKKIIHNDGWPVLLDGLGPTIFGYMFEGAIKFGVYEILKPIIRGYLATHSRFNSPWSAYLLCGLAAGFAASIVLCPMEAIRIRIVSERQYAVNGWVDGTRRMLRNEGTGFLSKGLTAMMFKQVPYTMTKNVSFDFFAMRLYAALIGLGVHLTPGIKVGVPFVAAVCASMLSCVSSQPGDMLLSVVNAHGDNKGTRHAIKDIMRSNKGVCGFFVGMQTRFLHVGVIVTLQLLLYDIIKRLCGIQATGL